MICAGIRNERGNAVYQQMPPTVKTQQKKRLGIFQILLILAALGFAGWYLYTALAPVASPYATIQSGMLGARYSGDCLIVRDETPYESEAVTNITYEAEEGEVIHRGTTICNVYASGYSTKETTTLQDYRDQIRDYQITLLESQTTYDARMERLENDVLDLAREFRGMIAGSRGNLSNQETMMETSIAARQQYLKQKFSSDQRLSRLYDDEQSQLQRIDSWTKQYAGTGDYIVSFYSDGYEYGLTTSNYDTFQPFEVRNMINGARPAGNSSASKTTIYRTISDAPWYVLLLVRNTEWNPVEGQTYQLKLEHFENTQVNARVLSFTRTGGELLVRLRVESGVKNVLYMRTCQAELGENVQSLMVPARALYTQDNTLGVVIVDGSNKLFIPVSVLLRDGDQVYITAIQQGLLYEGQTVILF